MTSNTFSFARQGAFGAAILIGLAVTEVAVADHHRAPRESVEIANHHDFVTGEILDGATVLIRDRQTRLVTANISSRALEPDTAYSLWWAVFNRPRFCIEPYHCALADLGQDADPRVRPSVFWAGGFLSDNSGTANTSVSLTRGRTSRELFARTKNYGLQDLLGSEIHLVGRSHGPIGLAGTVAEQIGTASEACPEGGCKNVFASIHIPER